MRHVLAYRDQYQITSFVDPLGPGGQEGERGDAHAIAVRALEAISATGNADRLRREADERARRDHAERERELAIDRAW